MATEVTLNDVERYHLLRARQAGQMAFAIDEFEFFQDDDLIFEALLHWAEAKAEADEIWLKKGYQEAMMQAWGIFDNA